jgi:lysophospholipase L1-like esterase
MAQACLFGSQLGWVSAESIMDESARTEAEFLRNLARARHGAHEFLLTGRFLGEVEVTGDNPHLKGEGVGSAKYAIDLPAVMATAWLSQEGELGIAAVNMSDAPRAVELRAPWSHLQSLIAREPWVFTSSASDLPAVQMLTLAPREARVIRIGTTTPTSSQAAQPHADRWEADIRKFVEADRQSPPPAGAVLFIGSSSIRMWKDVAADFPDTKVINRGFGGSRIADSTAHIDQIVAPYRPRMICLYAGDNDLAGGRTPQQVFDDYKEFVRQVRDKLPDVPIAYISIKPSPSRAKLLASMREANDLIRKYAAEAEGKKLLYIDVFTPMLSAEGQPRPELFGKDRLHMNRQGYDLWKATIAPYLK